MHNNAGPSRHEQTLADRLGRRSRSSVRTRDSLIPHGAQQSVVHLMEHPAPSGEGVRRTNHGRSFDRRDVWVGLKPTARLRTSRTCPGPSERQRRKQERNSFKWTEKSAQKVFDRAAIVRDVRLCDFHDRSLSRGQKLSRRASEERGCKSFLILRRVCWPLSRGSYFG